MKTTALLRSRTVSDGAAPALHVLASAVCPLRSARVVSETKRCRDQALRQELYSSPSWTEWTRDRPEKRGCSLPTGAASFFECRASPSARSPFGSAVIGGAGSARLASSAICVAKQPNLRSRRRLAKHVPRVSCVCMRCRLRRRTRGRGRSFRKWSRAPRDNIRAVRLGYRFREMPKKIHFS
jgi:hypothetical protein